MAKNGFSKRSSASGASSRGVSSARLHQKTGFQSAFGGYTKVSNSDGTFTMRKTGRARKKA